MGWIIWVLLALIILAFNYSASKNNDTYDSYILQKRQFDKHINNDSLVFVKYVGDDRYEIRQGYYALITISTTNEDKIVVELDDVLILYDDFKHFNTDWRFNEED